MEPLCRCIQAFRHIVVGALVSLSCVAAAHATLIYGLQRESAGVYSIITFRADNPGTIVRTQAVNGLLPGEGPFGLTFNPDTGQLYSIGTRSAGSRLVTIDPVNGNITQIGAGGLEYYFSDNISLSPIGSGRIRLFSGIIEDPFIVGQKNIQVNQFNGTALTSTELKYVEGDPAYGAVPRINAHAHTLPHSDALTTTLFGVDSSRNTLVRVGDVNTPLSINSGNLTTIGPLGIDPAFASLAIAPRTNIAHMVARPSGAGVVDSLYRVNLTTGAASLIGALGTTGFVSAIAIPDANKCFDLDGNGTISTTSDGLMLLRALLGFTGTAVTTNAVPPGPYTAENLPVRSNWSSIRNHLNDTCGMNFAP